MSGRVRAREFECICTAIKIMINAAASPGKNRRKSFQLALSTLSFVGRTRVHVHASVLHDLLLKKKKIAQDDAQDTSGFVACFYHEVCDLCSSDLFNVYFFCTY